MTRYGEPFSHHNKASFMLSLAGLFLSTSGVLLWGPLLTISKNDHGRTPIYLHVYAYLFLFNPFTFYLNMLLLHVRATIHNCAPEPSILVLLMKYLPPTTHAVSFTTLLLSAPLFFHAAVAEQSAGLAIGATLVCISLITILAYFFKKLLISHTSRDNMTVAIFSLFFSAGFFTSLVSENYQIDALTHSIPLHLLLSSGSFFLLMLGITQIFLSGVPADGHHTANCVKHWIIVAQSVTIPTLLVVGYVKVYAAVTDMAAVVIEAKL